MDATFESLGLGHLTPAEKLDLAGKLWDEALAAVPPAAVPLSDWQREELQRRLADAKANPDDWVSWEEMEAATLRRLGA